MYFVETTSELLGNLGLAGHAIGFGNFRLGDVAVHSNYRPDWQTLYQERGWMKSDPVVINGMRTEGFSDWVSPSKTTNIVMRAAADFGIRDGTTYASSIAGHRCIVGIALGREATELERATIRGTISRRHLEHLMLQAEQLKDEQIELVRIIANGGRAKDVAAHFGISEDSVKQRKGTIKRQMGVNSFYTVVNLCAMAGKTVPLIR